MSNRDLIRVLKDARVYVAGAYECAFPNERENEIMLQEIDDAIEALTKRESNA